MKDSERAADVATRMNVDIGLHLNFSEPLSACAVPAALAAEHRSIAEFLARSPYARLMYNPMLRTAFRNVYDAQIEEFNRLYGRAPSHIDGHHHQHLCANMLVDPLIPRGFRVRRNFTFVVGEKGIMNRGYRRLVDICLARRYVITDYFFSLQQSLNGHARSLVEISDLAKVGDVELMTHPRNPEEFGCLSGMQFERLLGAIAPGARHAIRSSRVPSWERGWMQSSTRRPGLRRRSFLN